MVNEISLPSYRQALIFEHTPLGGARGGFDQEGFLRPLRAPEISAKVNEILVFNATDVVPSTHREERQWGHF